MRNLREWTTPLTVGAFALMSVTGLLMFFHLDSGLNKTAHEWLGWLMVAAVAGHATANWGALKRYFISSKLARGIVGGCLAVLAASFLSLPGRGKDLPPPLLAFHAVTNAPISSLAPLSERSVDQVIADLLAVGIKVPDAHASLDSIAAGNREIMGKAVRTLFGKQRLPGEQQDFLPPTP
jgi:hypothetical protein